MQLLIDENLSDRIAAKVADLYPGSIHVKQSNLIQAEDWVIWNYAEANGFVIVSKDWDFHQLSLVHGFPPKVIYLDVGNWPTRDILSLLRSNHFTIKNFFDSPVESILIINQ